MFKTKAGNITFLLSIIVFLILLHISLANNWAITPIIFIIGILLFAPPAIMIVVICTLRFFIDLNNKRKNC